MEVQDHMQAIANAQLEIKAGHVPPVVSMAKEGAPHAEGPSDAGAEGLDGLRLAH
jgi:hypothetical protein